MGNSGKGKDDTEYLSGGGWVMEGERNSEKRKDDTGYLSGGGGGGLGVECETETPAKAKTTLSTSRRMGGPRNVSETRAKTRTTRNISWGMSGSRNVATSCIIFPAKAWHFEARAQEVQNCNNNY